MEACIADPKATLSNARAVVRRNLFDRNGVHALARVCLEIGVPELMDPLAAMALQFKCTEQEVVEAALSPRFFGDSSEANPLYSSRYFSGLEWVKPKNLDHLLKTELSEEVIGLNLGDADWRSVENLVRAASRGWGAGIRALAFHGSYLPQTMLGELFQVPLAQELQILVFTNHQGAMESLDWLTKSAATATMRTMRFHGLRVAVKPALEKCEWPQLLGVRSKGTLDNDVDWMKESVS